MVRSKCSSSVPSSSNRIQEINFEILCCFGRKTFIDRSHGVSRLILLDLLFNLPHGNILLTLSFLIKIILILLQLLHISTIFLRLLSFLKNKRFSQRAIRSLLLLCRIKIRTQLISSYLHFRFPIKR